MQRTRLSLPMFRSLCWMCLPQLSVNLESVINDLAKQLVVSFPCESRAHGVYLLASDPFISASCSCTLQTETRFYL